MKLSIDEFKQLTDIVHKPIEMKFEKPSSVTISVKTKKDDSLEKPLFIEDQEIKQLGIHRINDINFWIVKR